MCSKSIKITIEHTNCMTASKLLFYDNPISAILIPVYRKMFLSYKYFARCQHYNYFSVAPKTRLAFHLISNGYKGYCCITVRQFERCECIVLRASVKVTFKVMTLLVVKNKVKARVINISSVSEQLPFTLVLLTMNNKQSLILLDYLFYISTKPLFYKTTTTTETKHGAQGGIQDFPLGGHQPSLEGAPTSDTGTFW